MINDKTAKLLLEEERYEGNANTPTIHKEYACPCGNGRIIYEEVPGFNDYFARIACPTCATKYTVIYGCGHKWELKEK